MRRLVWGFAAAILMFSPAAASADVIELQELAINIDGTVHDSLGPPVLPLSFPGLDDSGFDYDTGLGSFTVRVSGAGPHFVAAFYDHDLFDPTGNNTIFDDSGEALGVPPPGVGWEIDEPGFGITYVGDIFTNFSNGNLDETVFDGVITQEDASMALSWDIVLAANETAFVTFITSITDPGGFRLHQFDAADDVYLSSTLRIVEGQIPEPGLLVLMGFGVLASARRRLRG